MLGMAISVAGFLLIILISYLFSKMIKKQVKSKVQKREEIIENYKQNLHNCLKDLSSKEYEEKKISLLSDISKELDRNIFFDKSEVRGIVQKLADES